MDEYVKKSDIIRIIRKYASDCESLEGTAAIITFGSKVLNLPTIETASPLKMIKDFNEYQKDWILAHNYIEFDKDIEPVIVETLDDTAFCYMRELGIDD